MMKREDKIAEEVRRTMQALDELQRVEGNPYLYTRIRARMQAERPGRQRVWSGAWAYVLTVVVLALNVWTVINRLDDTGAAQAEVIEALADDYGLVIEETYYPEFDQ